MTLSGRVAPFGDPRFKACSQLTVAFRSVPRPSSPPDAKASTKCPSTLDPNHPTQPDVPEQNLSPCGYLRFCSMNFSPKNPLPAFAYLRGFLIGDQLSRMFSDQNPRRSKQTQNKSRTHYRQKPIPHVTRPRPSQSNYVKTLFTMTNNKKTAKPNAVSKTRTSCKTTVLWALPFALLIT